ncbi:unnamed protein product [Musa hybrid cultivar]
MTTTTDMSKLQRSAMSFRRQGSSGRIWNDPMRGVELNGAAVPVPEPVTSIPELKADAAVAVPPQVPPVKKKKRWRPWSVGFCLCARPTPANA